MSNISRVKISALGKTITGKTPSSNNPEDFGSDYMFVTPSDSFDKKMMNLTERYLSEEGVQKLSSKLLPPNSIMVTCIGSAMGKVSMNETSCVTNQQINSIVPNNNFDPHYIYYTIKNNYKVLRNAATGSTAVPLLNKTDFDILELLIHKDLPTQKSIAKVLSDLDAKIELNNRINRELEAMAKTLYDYWFVQFDFPNADGKPYKSSGGKMVYNAELKREIPEGWEVKKLGELVYQVTDSISPDEYPELPYLPIDKLPMKQLYYYEYESRSEANSSLIRFKENDILLGAMRVYFHRVCHAISDGISRSTIIVLRPFKENTKNFALFALNKNEAIEFATNNSTGTSIPYAKWNDSLENYLIGVPKTDYILILFNKIVNPILEKFKVQNKQTQQLTELRDWLLPMLMNGQVTVRQAHGNAVKEAEESLSMAAEPSVEYKKG